MKTAIVYDRVNKWGGAERVLLALHELFPEAPLYTSVYDKKKAPWAKVFPKVKTTFLQNLPILNNYHELLGWLTPIAYETFNFDKYDLVISVTSEAAKGIITKPKTLHLCYCLTPTRYLWSGYEEYLNNPPKNLSWIPLYKILSQPFLKYTKKWDMVAAQRPDVMIAISTEVKKRIKKYYKRESELVYPPIEPPKFRKKNQKHKKPDNAGCSISEIDYVQTSGSKNLIKTDYYLVVSRLVPYERVDLAIESFNKLGLPLVIIGTGSEEKGLKRVAKENIHFEGFVKEEDLANYYLNAKALIYPQEEDFGITAVESQAAGTPVIAYKKGGALDTVIDSKTGIFFEEQRKESLIEAIQRFESLDFSKEDLVKNAKKFSKDRFKKEFGRLVDELLLAK